MSARWPPRHEKRIFDVFYDVILFLETTYRNRFGDSCCFYAEFSSLIYNQHWARLRHSLFRRASVHIVRTSLSSCRVDALIVLFVVMAAYVDTAIIMCSALIVDVTCLNTATRTLLVSAVSRVPRN